METFRQAWFLATASPISRSASCATLAGLDEEPEAVERGRGIRIVVPG